MTERLNIYQKLARIRKSVEVMSKNKAGFNYKYVSEDELLAKITVQMNKLGLSLLPGVVQNTIAVSPYNYITTKVLKDGKVIETQNNEILVHAEMTWTWVNDENPNEKVVTPWVLVGQQGDASRAFGSALTYSERYFLLKFFNVATVDDDPDAFRSKQLRAEAEESEMISKEIIGKLDEMVKRYITESGNRDDVRAFFTKAVKNGDYLKVKDPVIASKLLEDFQKTFLKENGGK